MTYIVANTVSIGTGSTTHLDFLDTASNDFTGTDLEHTLGPIVSTGINPPPGHTHHTGAKANTADGLLELDSDFARHHHPYLSLETIPPPQPPSIDSSHPNHPPSPCSVPGLLGASHRHQFPSQTHQLNVP